MKARAPDGRAWFDQRFEKETHEWLVEMAVNQLPLYALSMLQTIAVLALARAMAVSDGEMKTL